jgi:hypothetical protein
MDFKLTCTLSKTLWTSDDRSSRLVLVTEKIPGKDFTKNWAIWTSAELFNNQEYIISGYITEAPNKGFINEQGKVAYKANFNATQVLHADETYSFGEPPKLDDTTIPF